VIGIVDYDAGNITSVSNALTSAGAEFLVSGESKVLARCDGIILPGVGAAPGAMASLNERKLTGFLGSLEVPVLGICLGMQVLFESSEEGNTTCLGVLPGVVKKFDDRVSKVPHMGWNRVDVTSKNPLIGDAPNSEFYYFANSYAAEVDGSTIGISHCEVPFSAAVARGNYYGVQFHPEKSGIAGLAILKNFEALCRSYRR
jgi:glutamine amidotransferase